VEEIMNMRDKILNPSTSHEEIRNMIEKSPSSSAAETICAECIAPCSDYVVFINDQPHCYACALKKGYTIQAPNTDKMPLVDYGYELKFPEQQEGQRQPHGGFLVLTAVAKNIGMQGFTVDTRSVYINPDQVVMFIRSEDEPVTEMTLRDGRFVCVHETPEEIIKQLYE